jgi:hypothetical protein
MDLPASLVTIGTQIFYNCSALARVTLPASLDALAVATQTFYGCNNITFEVQGSGRFSAAGDGKLLILDGNTVFAGNGVSGTFTIPAGITTIGKYAFETSALTTINLGSVTTIGQYAFNLNSSLSSVDFGSVTGVEASAFRSCTSLVRVDLPASLDSIMSSAFYGCTSLSTVIVRRETAPSTTLSDTAVILPIFNSNAPGRLIYVPDTKVAEYQAAIYWSTYAASIKPMSELP